MENYQKEKEEFARTFSKKNGDEIILWSGNDKSIGFTILRNYPNNISFKPAKNKEGEVDSVCMIKIGFSVKDLQEKNEINLYVSIVKASRYLLDNHYDYNFDDNKSPTKDSLEESKRSMQPFDLENLTDYVYQIERKRIVNKKKGSREEKINDVVETIFQSHLKTIKLTGLWFRTKVNLRNLVTTPVEQIKDFLFWLLKFIFGKTMQSSKDVDFGVGIFKTYNHSNLYTLADEQVDFFNTGIKIPKKSGLLVAFVIVAMTVFFTYLHNPVWWANLKEQSQIIQVSFLLVLIFVIDYVIPHVFLSLINLLVRFRLKMWDWKIRID